MATFGWIVTILVIGGVAFTAGYVIGYRSGFDDKEAGLRR